LNFQLVTEAPLWMLVFCPMAGFLYAWFLYRKETTFSGVAKWLTTLMAVFRFLTVSFLVLLLLSPLVKTIFTDVERPLIIFLQDDSQSVISVNDSAIVKKQYPQAVGKIFKGLESDFDIRIFSIGEKIAENVNFVFGDRITDLSDYTGLRWDF
jgi:hypothetical protein